MTLGKSPTSEDAFRSGTGFCRDRVSETFVSGPCAPSEITQRFGRGSYRVTAYGFDPPGLRWEVLVEDLAGT